jgi:hypothetical protein
MLFEVWEGKEGDLKMLCHAEGLISREGRG